jgi:hypothetical protein
MKFIPALDGGSYLAVAHITRLFVTENVTDTLPFAVKASIPGEQMPFAVAKCESRSAAEAYVQNLVNDIEASSQ